MKDKKIFLALLALLAALLLVGCGAEAQPAAAPEQSAEEQSAPETEAPLAFSLGTLSVSPETESIDLAASGASIEELMSLSDKLSGVKEIALGVPEATLAQLQALEEAFPQAVVNWKAELLGEQIDCHAESLDLSGATDEDTAQIVSALAVLPELKTLELAPEDGLTTLSFDSLSALAAAAPQAELNCRFELFGQTADWTTEKLKYYRTDVGNDGVDLFRAALPYLRGLDLLRFEECGITDNDKMAALRADFPEKRVVWSIPIEGYTFMTDTTLINAALLLTDENVDVLRYMPDVLYLDIGHNHYLTNIEFVRNFPKLQVVIVTLTNITDITPLEDCPDMEFLEMVSTNIDNIDVVAGMDKLEYLNLGCMPQLRDISPVSGLKNLKMVRICGTTFSHITQEDVDRLKEELPDTYVSDYGGDPTKSGHWRFNDDWSYTERYALLREQMRYDLIDWQQMLSNSPSGEED